MVEEIINKSEIEVYLYNEVLHSTKNRWTVATSHKHNIEGGGKPDTTEILFL